MASGELPGSSARSPRDKGGVLLAIVVDRLRHGSRHWPLLAVMAVAALPLFAGLGQSHLWADEGDTAVLGLSILGRGLPTAWDGVTFTDSDFGARENDHMVMVSHPWVQFYLAAASFALFGGSAWAARLPFALAGMLTLPALYFLVLRLADRRTAVVALLLTATSAQFFLFSRQCRHYSLNMLFTCLLVLSFLHLGRAGGRWLFGAVAVVLFHVHPLPALATLSALAMLTVCHAPFRSHRRGFALTMAPTLCLTVPWFWLGEATLRYNTMRLGPDRLGLMVSRLAQFVIEWAAVTPVFAWVFLAAVLAVQRLQRVRGARRLWTGRSGERPRGVSVAASVPPVRPLLEPGQHSLLLAVGLVLAATGLLASYSLSAQSLFMTGLRNVTAVIPLGAAVTAVLVGGVAGHRRWLHAALVCVLAATNLGRITPWALGHGTGLPDADPERVTLHPPNDWKVAWLPVEVPTFLGELTLENPGSIASVARFLNENARPGDIVITNYGWEPLYFHTRLPQGLKIMKDYPVYAAARRYGLPEYVFSVQGARWIVWRWPWEGYRGYEFERTARDVESRGGALTRVAAFPETVWENQPNIHFHRFATKGHLFAFARSDVTADVFRVDWPGRAATSPPPSRPAASAKSRPSG